MIDIKRRTVHHVREEFIIPSPACNRDVNDAIHKAVRHKYGGDASKIATGWGDDEVRVEARDDEIVVSYVIEKDMDCKPTLKPAPTDSGWLETER